ncbi:hypothetical protein [Pseudoalteromonas sp. McH1-42]|uniref:hypothetical protein n=1 Tax=Pseudoalteromonas sp. McH1-42 TaxID=2917752 RepID=UPI001EF70051|nr:hypothetical protein [Pseudoalteromonas sp. McH1-42]MCG7561571.1 hypothetical protein [Pseudoalteromonas sp. McH1-42]
MSRTAESTIKGFLYQFQKTIKSILESSYEDTVTVEGIVEDVDLVHADGSTTAIQCKYHESVEAFSLSLIYKPILQMAENYAANPNADITYKLFVHVQNQSSSSRSVTEAELNAALASTNVKLQPIINRIPNNLDKVGFLTKLTLEFGESIDDLALSIKALLSDIEIDNSDVESILYPNSINHIARLSCGDTPESRQINRADFERFLSNSNSTAISKWTLALNTKKQLLTSKRRQLSQYLSQNSRERCFYLSKDQLVDFCDGIVVFISNFLAKYHTKALHLKTPIFVLDCNSDELSEIQYRLYVKGIKACTGYIGSTFEVQEFFREPIKNNSRSLVNEREFQIRILSYEAQPEAVNYRKCDDLFFVCKNKPSEIDCIDIEMSEIGVPNFSELEFVLSIRNDYE